MPELLTAGEGARGDAGGGWPGQRGRAAGLGPGGEEADVAGEVFHGMSVQVGDSNK